MADRFCVIRGSLGLASGPYMHDGRFATLRDVIEHYDHGVNASPQLTDDTFLNDPKFSDPF